MTYSVRTPTQTTRFEAEPRLTFRQILANVPNPTFPLHINGYKVLERDNQDRTLPTEYIPDFWD